MGQPLSVTVLSRPMEFGPNTVELLFDNNPNSFWITPANNSYPQAFVVQVHPNAIVDGIYIDPRLPGYEPCGPANVSVEVASPQNPDNWFRVGTGALPYAQPGTIALHPAEAGFVKIIFESNHGGPCLAAVSLQILGTPGSMQQYAQNPAMFGQAIQGGQGPGGKPMGGIDPNTGKPMGGVDPYTGKPMGGVAQHSGKPMDPYAGKPGDPYAGKPMDPYAGKPGDPYAGKPADPYSGKPMDPYAGKPADPYGGKGGDPYAGKPADPYGGKGGDAYSQQGDWGGGYQPGQRVLGMAPDGNWYPATIQQVSGNQYMVVFDGVPQPQWLAEDQVAPEG